MGLFDLMFKEVEVKEKPKKKFRDYLVKEVDVSESKTSLTEKISQLMFKDETPNVEFTDSQPLQEMADTIKGKLQDKKRELTMLGMALTKIKVEEFPGSEEVINDYLGLVQEQKRLSEEEANVSDIMGKISLDREYAEFEALYEQKIPRIKSLFLLQEMRIQNNNMKSVFNKTSGKNITDSQVNQYIDYIRKISDQKSTFHSQYSDQLIEELIIAEYRLKMLMLMREVAYGEEPYRNPFSRCDKVKKAKFGELLLQDIAESDEQYQRISNRRSLYIRTNIYTPTTFDELDSQAQALSIKIDNGLIDDFSIDEIFENSEYDTLKMFLRLKDNMNTIDSKHSEALEIATEDYNRKNSKKPDFDDDWEL